MDDNTVIKIENVSKKYCKSLKKSMLYGIHDIARNTLGMSSRPDILRKDEFWAVNGISFDVKKGEVLGIIGPNGSGKTTLLKMLSGIFWPDKGKITIKGRIGSLIEVGVGFHPLLTGRENVYLNGAILGMTKEEVDERFDPIVEFAGIGDFIDAPVKHYSSGMFVRLGFACMIKFNSDILIIDEAFAVGDLNFQQKCYKQLGEFRKDLKTILLVSHDMDAIRTLCDSAVLLDYGCKIQHGPPGEVIDYYLGMTFKRLHKGSVPVDIKKERIEKSSDAINDSCVFIGTGEVKLRSLTILDDNGNEISHVLNNESFKIVFEIISSKDIPEPHYGIEFLNGRALQIYAANTYTLRLEPQPVKSGEIVRVEYKLKCLLSPGEYSISIGVANKGIDRKTFQFEEFLLSMQNVASLNVIEDSNRASFSGIFDMQPEVTIHSIKDPF